MREAVTCALAELAQRDERIAESARRALDTLVPDHDIERLTQHRLQRFCWYELPVRFHDSAEERLFAVRSLGRLFSLLQLHRYAHVCTSAETVTLLTTYDEDHDTGLAMYERLMWESGVQPPDLPELTWGASVGEAEIRAHGETAAALELAISLGDIRPGRHGWRPAQERFARSFLIQPDSKGLSHLDRIREERVRAWLGSSSHPHRQRMWPLVGLLIAGVDVPRTADRAMEPLRALLDLAEDGIALTQVGYLSPAVVRRLCEDFGWRSSPEPPRSETDCTQVIALHQLLRSMHAVRCSGRRLVLTRRGRLLRGDTEALWWAAAGAVCRSGGIERAAVETLLGILLDRTPQGTGSHTRRAESDAAAAERVLVESGWTPVESPMPAGRHAATRSETAETGSDQVRAMVTAVNWLLEALDLLVGGEVEGRGGLTATGRAFALACLHKSAVAPRAVV